MHRLLPDRGPRRQRDELHQHRPDGRHDVLLSRAGPECRWAVRVLERRHRNHERSAGGALHLELRQDQGWPPVHVRRRQFQRRPRRRSEEHTSELQSQSHISYAVFCLKKKKKQKKKTNKHYYKKKKKKKN